MEEITSRTKFGTCKALETWVCQEEGMFNGRRLIQVSPFGERVVFEVQGYSPGDDMVKARAVGVVADNGDVLPYKEDEKRGLILLVRLRSGGWESEGPIAYFNLKGVKKVNFE